MTTEPVTPPTVEDVCRLVSDFGAAQFEAGIASVEPDVAQLKSLYDAEVTANKVLQQKLTDALAEIERLKNPIPEPTPVTFEIGSAVGSNTDPSAMETRMGVKLDAWRTYENGDGDQQITDTVNRIKANIAKGRKRSSVSVKVPVSMASAATGGADAWAKRLALAIAAAIKGTTHKVRVAINHEPENDVAIVRVSGSVTNGTQLVAYRDNWKKFQNRVAPFFDLPGIDYIIIVMGDHQWNTGANYYPWWSQDKLMSGLVDEVKGVGYDFYERYSNTHKTWTNWGWVSKAATWFALHKRPSGQGYLWGLSETAWTEEAEALKPGQFGRVMGLVKSAGGSWLEYFSTLLNSSEHWQIEPGDRREKDLAATLKGNR